MAISPKKTATPPADKIQNSIRRHLLFGVAVVIGLFGVAGGWATLTKISGAVVAPGQLVVEGNVKKVQHPTGGVVDAILVKDGDHVKAQDVLLRLDTTTAKANLAIVSTNVDELQIRRAREMAELSGGDGFALPTELADRADDPNIKANYAQEIAVLKTKSNAMASQKSQLQERVKQLEEEINGVKQQVDAKATETKYVESQLAAQQRLLDQKLAAQQRVDDVHKELARLQGERGSLLATIAQNKGKISETKLQILGLGQDHLTEISKELRETESKLSEANERAIANRDQLTKTEVRAPQDGVIYQLSVHAKGSVVSPSEAIMIIHTYKVCEYKKYFA